VEKLILDTNSYKGVVKKAGAKKAASGKAKKKAE